MILLFKILFWVSVISILHTYFFYPLILITLSNKRNKSVKKAPNFQPEIAIVFAAYNEESVIESKLKSIFKTDYPLDKIKVYVGSDASTDKTDDIILDWKEKYPRNYFKRFEERTGKSGIINHLFDVCEEELVIGTDANIIFDEKTIPNFVRHFEDEEVDMVGGNISYLKNTNDGISRQEDTYLSLENKIKQAESDLWGKVQGVEGGLYCIRKKRFNPIPPLTFMEDFFITFSVLRQNGTVLFDQEVMGYEDVSTLQEEEFKRKTRISIGNFQNLARFKSLLFSQPYPLGYAFLSHKVLRWATPFFALVAILCAFMLQQELIYQYFLNLTLYLLLLTLLDWLLYRLKVKSGPLRYIGHFIMMNLALLNGFIKYIKGVRTNVWQPTKRNQ